MSELTNSSCPGYFILIGRPQKPGVHYMYINIYIFGCLCIFPGDDGAGGGGMERGYVLSPAAKNRDEDLELTATD